jgi:uncharacterized protein (DUF4415 family)
MSNGTTGKPSAAELERLRRLADEDIVPDDDEPYDPNDPAAVEAFWQDAVVVKEGGYPAVRAALAEQRRTRGPGQKPKKILLSVRYSPEVVEYFRATGEGWQARMDEALKEWIREHACG